MKRAPQRGTYLDFGKMPGEMMRMVIDGRARIIGKDKLGRKVYELVRPAPPRDFNRIVKP